MSTTLTTATVFIDGLLAGVFLCSAMIEHAMRSLDAPKWLAYVHAKEKVFGPVMPVFFSVALFVTIAAAVVSAPHEAATIAAVALGGAGVITGAVNLPLNARFKAWSAADHPPGWALERAKWQRWTIIRTILAVVAFAVMV